MASIQSFRLLLEAQLLCNLIDITDSLHHVMFSFFDHFSVVVNRFLRFLRFGHLKFEKMAISDGCRSKMPGNGGGDIIFRAELFGPW